MSIFPIIQPEASETSTELILYKEVKWDFENNVPVFLNGAPVIVTGKEAVLVWVRKALQTQRYRHEIYTWDYGCENESLIGKPFTDELKQSEATRYVKECLMINQYIIDVKNIKTEFSGETLIINATIETIYGEAELNV
jgi:Protein of unknown function (DUF2634).